MAPVKKFLLMALLCGFLGVVVGCDTGPAKPADKPAAKAGGDAKPADAPKPAEPAKK
jgi:hypothetical protein